MRTVTQIVIQHKKFSSRYVDSMWIQRLTGLAKWCFFGHHVQQVSNQTVSVGDIQRLVSTQLVGGLFLDSWLLKTQSAKFWPNFHFQVGVGGGRQWGGRGEAEGRERGGEGWGEGESFEKNRVFLAKWAKKIAKPNSGRPCIVDSLSHTICVETNETANVLAMRLSN